MTTCTFQVNSITPVSVLTQHAQQLLPSAYGKKLVAVRLLLFLGSGLTQCDAFVHKTDPDTRDYCAVSAYAAS